MKKIFSLFILILTLCLGSTAFAGKAWSEIKFETFLKNMGYGEHDISSFTDDGDNLSNIQHLLAKNDNKKIFLYSSTKNKFYLYFINSDVDVYFSYLKDKESYNITKSDSTYLHSYTLDLNNKVISSLYGFYNPNAWKKENCIVTEEEWNSTAYKTFLFKQVCIYSDSIIKNTNYIPQGGKITSSGYEDKMYNGSISYGNTTKTATITYTSGFESNTNYDLFLERYQLGETYDYGIAEYPLETIDLGHITTTDTSVNIDISNLALGSMNVYRLCVGINSFNNSGENIIFLCTDWLLPNDNTLWKFPTFTRSHYIQPLNLVAYDSSYIDPVPEPDEDLGESSGDNGSNIEDYLPYFISVPAYPQKNECLVYFYIGDYGVNNLSFLIEEIDDSGAILSSNSLSYSIIDNINYGMSKIDFCKYFNFKDNSFYKITLIGKDGVKLDISSTIYFLGSNTGNYTGDKPYFINSPKGYLRNSGDVVVNVYMPNGYDYEDSVYLSVQKYNLSGDYINSTIVGDSNMWLQLDIESGICPIYVSSFCDFDFNSDYYYRINLNEFQNGVLDTTDIFYFNIDTGENMDKDNLPINPNDPLLNFDTTDINSLVNSTTSWVGTVFGFLNIFPPWFVLCITSGIAVIIVCRILGR